EHRLQMIDLGKAFGGTATDALRRRVGREELGMRGFERLELVHQLVEIGVADLGRCLYVVQLFVPANFLSELVDSLRGIHAETPLRRRSGRAEGVALTDRAGARNRRGPSGPLVPGSARTGAAGVSRRRRTPPRARRRSRSIDAREAAP